MRTIACGFVVLIVISLAPATAQQNFSDYNSLMRHWLAVSDYELTDEDALAEWYIQNHQQDIHREYRNDEFEYRRRLAAAKEAGLQWLADFNDEPYVIYTQVEFGEYDFEREGFPINSGFSEGYFFYKKGSGVSAPFAVEGQPEHERLDSLSRLVKMTFLNNEVMNGLYIDMEPDQAEAFVAERRNSYGSVDRSLRLRLVAEVRGAGLGQARLRYGNYDKALELRADVVEAAFYKGEGRNEDPVKEVEINL